MAARPAKRQRRSTVVASDSEEETLQNAKLPVRTTAKSTTTLKRSSSTKSTPKTSPAKSRAGNNQNANVKPNKSLHSFFGKATEEQRWSRRETTPKEEPDEILAIDDIIDDDDDDYFRNEDTTALPSKSGSRSSNAMKSTRLFGNTRAHNGRNSTPTSSQRFTKSAEVNDHSDLVLPTTERVDDIEQKPWAEQFRPDNLDELAIHKKKAMDVQKWLEDVFTGRSPQRVLVLKGPAGSGKSTTISLIASVLGVETILWRNPTVSDAGNASSSQQFSDFLERGGRFDALSFGNEESMQASNSASDQQLLLIEDFPATVTRSSSAIESFRSALLAHVLRALPNAPFGVAKPVNKSPPVVLIISESLLSSSTALSDSFTAHRLLGVELLNHPFVSTIEFNRVAPTFMLKALDSVITKEAKVSMRRRIPGSAILQQLAEMGDIRSAINSLEFLCARNGDAGDWSGTVASRSKKASKHTASLTESEKNALQLISHRESTLDMFHATGKIVYNKREDPRLSDKRAEPPPKPPDHLMHFYTTKVSQVDVDALLNEIGTDIQTFIATLHENYALSCNSDDFVDIFANCADILSDSDYLNPASRSLVRNKESGGLQRANLQSGNFDMLRQDEISFQVASRGLLFALPFPVNRAVPSGSRKQDAFKMFYPTSLRLWKPAEEINDLLSMYSSLQTSGQGYQTSSSANGQGVSSWKSRNFSMQPTLEINSTADKKTDFARSFFSKDNLVVELLPFLTHIEDARQGNVQILNKITQLRGVTILGEEEVYEEQPQGNAKLLPTSERLQRKVEEAHNLLRGQKSPSYSNSTSKSMAQNAHQVAKDLTHEEKMYISDDDIQDD